MEQLKITIKTLHNFEDILTDELRELGYENTEKQNRAVTLKGTWEDVYRLNYRCRLALSVLVEIDAFYVHKEDDLYKAARKIDWTELFDNHKTFAVKGAIFSTLFRHSNYPLLLVKDAIVDTFRDKTGKRPNVNRESPQVVVDVYIKEKRVTLSVNTSGLPLFQRGYRQSTGEAPINEVLAAGLLRMTGWDRQSPLIDPMCGSGTIAIEAALWAADIPALVERNHYAFKNFKSYQPDLWEKIRSEANQRPIDLGFPIIASDIDAGMVQKARRNSRMAPIGRMISFETADIRDWNPSFEKGVLICNPPYGERLDEDIAPLYQDIGDVFKQNFKGFSCWIISSNGDALKGIGLKPQSKTRVFNGSLECSFRGFEIVEGSFGSSKSMDASSELLDDEGGGQDEHEATKNDRQAVKEKSEKPKRKSTSDEQSSSRERKENGDHRDEKSAEKRASTPVEPAKKDASEEQKGFKEKIEAMRKYRKRTDD